MPRKRLAGLRSEVYEHPLDRKALDVVMHSGGFQKVVATLNEMSYERVLQVQLTGSHLQVTPDSMPAVYDAFREAADNLDISNLPRLFVAEQGMINALTTGHASPIIVLSSEAIDALTLDELLFVLGHELGHVKSGHVLYYQIAEFLPVIGGVIGDLTFGLGQMIFNSLQVGLLNWKRIAEFTSDRAGLLACQDMSVALSVLMKLAGLPRKLYGTANTEDFIQQARNFKALDADKLNWLAKKLSVIGSTHPWTVHRAQECLNWADGGGYDAVLDTDHADHRAIDARTCRHCGHVNKVGSAFCAKCGQPLSLARGADHR